jgi:hypothetical protein
LEAFLKWSDVFGAMGDVLRALNMIRRLSRSNFNNCLLGRLWLDEVCRGEVFMLAIKKRAFDRLLNKELPTRVILPYEGRAWERCLVRQARDHRIFSIGYQHSSLTQRHRALLYASEATTTDWIPDRIICCGEITASRLVRANPAYKNRLYVGAALRTETVTLPAPGNGILVALSSSRNEASEIFRFFASACERGLRIPLIFRPHPTIPAKDLFKRYKWPVETFFSEGRSLADDLSAAWCVAYSSATVVLEGMRHDRIPLYIDIGDILSGDPLESGLTFKLTASSPEDLLISIESILRTSDRLADLGKAARSYAEKYLIESNNERIAQMSSWLVRP